MQLHDEWDLRNFMYCPNYFIFANENPELNIKKIIQEDLWKYLKQAEPLFLSNIAVEKNRIYEFIAGLNITKIPNLPTGYKKYADVMAMTLYNIISKFADGHNDDYEVGPSVKITLEKLNDATVEIWTDLIFVRSDRSLIFIKCFPFPDSSKIERRFAQFAPLALNQYYKSLYDVPMITYMVYSFKNMIFQREYYGEPSHKAFASYVHKYGKFIQNSDSILQKTKHHRCFNWCPFNKHCHIKWRRQKFTYEEEKQICKEYATIRVIDILEKWKCSKQTFFNIINRHGSNKN